MLSRIEEVKKILRKNPLDWHRKGIGKRVNDTAEEICRLDESSLPTESEMGESLADGEGETFPNAREAIRRLGTPITKEVYCSPADESRLLTDKKLIQISDKYVGSPMAAQIATRDAQDAKTVSIKDAEYQARVESIFGEIENEGKFLHPEHIFLSGQEWQELKVKYLRKGVK